MDCLFCSIKRVVRYLIGRPRLVWRFVWQEAPKFISAFSDSNWAGCHDTRKSTTGACLMHGSHLVKAFSRTQSNIALSSGEAEFYGVVKAAGIGLGYVSLLEDVGVSLPLRVWTDSIATIGICGRQVLGKLRHVDTQCLWIQQRFRDGSFELRKVLGTDMPADLFTKHLGPEEKANGILNMLTCYRDAGRAQTAPK